MGPGESTAQARMVSGGIVSFRSMSDNDDGTVGVGHTMLTDRPEQEADHFAMTATADHQEVGTS